MGTLVYIMKLPALHSQRIHILRFLAILVIISTINNARAQHIEDEDLYESPERRSGSMSMMRLKKSDVNEEEVRNDLKDLLYKRAMSMMRLKKFPTFSGNPLLYKDMEANMCVDYPDLC